MYPFDPEDDDYLAPEFMVPYGGVCSSTGCSNPRLKDKRKCIDCEVDSALPDLFVEIETITQKGR